jgi:GT2 family glycosyltransferase
VDYPQRLALNGDVLELILQLHTKRVGLGELISRLVGERELFAGPVLERGSRPWSVGLVLIVEGSPGRMLELTLRMWGLQSCPTVRTIVVPAQAANGRQVRAWLDAVRPPLSLNVEVDENWAPSRLRDCEFVVFGRAGDILHPSLATVLLVAAAEQKADIIVWNDARYIPDDAGGGRVCELLRRPKLERHTLRQLPYIGTAFAVKPSLLDEYPYAAVNHVLTADAHPLHLWAAEQGAAEWQTHPEYLSLRPVGVGAKPAQEPELVGVYQGLLQLLAGDFLVKPEAGGPLPYRLEPRRRASKISVVIPFRDRPDETSRCLRSVVRQEVSGALEVILVDNNSTVGSRAQVGRVIAEAGGHEIHVMEYPHPFNHSRECTLGAELATGDVLVFLNNDAELLSPATLEEMAAWALLPGVATTGCRITRQDGTLVCAGMRVEPEGLCRESEEAVYSTVVRETLGNTFACAAVSRGALRAVGPLDDVAFPNGYNDVEWCLRARRAGLRHVYLGHLRVNHRPATSRGASDESFQRALLKVRFPELAQAALFQLERRTVGGSAARRAPAVAAMRKASRWLRTTWFGQWQGPRRVS